MSLGPFLAKQFFQEDLFGGVNSVHLGLPPKSPCFFPSIPKCYCLSIARWKRPRCPHCHLYNNHGDTILGVHYVWKVHG